MVKIWIIYHTKYGNCRKVGEELKNTLSDKFDVCIGDVKKIKLDDITKDIPNILIVGSRIIIGSPDRKIKKFIKKLGAKLETPISKAATYYTHVLEWDSKYAKMAKLLKDNKVADDIFPEILNIKVRKTKGPAESGQENKIRFFTENISKFL